MESGDDAIDGRCINPIVHDHAHLPPGYQSDLDGIFLFQAGDQILGRHGDLIVEFEKYHVGQGDLWVACHSGDFKAGDVFKPCVSRAALV